MEKLLIENIGMLATPIGTSARRGAEQGQIRILRNAWLLMEDGLIADLGTGDPPQDITERFDVEGSLVTPGLVDSHTHLIFGGWRQNELGLKLHGVSYLEILAQGGGILSTVKATRAAEEEELFEKAWDALDEMLDDLAATFLGAHALPPEYKENRESYLRLLCDTVIPQVSEKKLAEFCDVFCETGVFTAEESKRILEAGKRCGLIPKIHADEIDPIGGSQLTAEVGAISAEHLIVCPPEGIEAMAKAGTVACCLPATSFYLGSTYAPVRDMIQAGVESAVRHESGLPAL